MKIKIKYIDKNMPKLEHIGGNKNSNWIDVRASRVIINGREIKFIRNGIEYKAGDFLQIYLGFALELPKGYEGHTAPRGSTFKNFGLIQTNSVGVADEAFCGDNDEWFMPLYALKGGVIEKYDRIGQFRIMEKMPDISFEEVESLGNPDRGSQGSTGTK